MRDLWTYEKPKMWINNLIITSYEIIIMYIILRVNMIYKNYCNLNMNDYNIQIDGI